MASALVKALSILVCLVALIKSTEGLSNPHCFYVRDCPNLTKFDCPFGIVTDIYRCCDTCLKGPGEECGGLLSEFGICGRYLTCKRNNIPNYPGSNYIPGKCA
ncbi:single insulin-like growth factor-binding domain protein-2 [Palaemon carinicauda]|uniref:single insulin-like growth factor-binding domain protein-2 n=1 Tax=Palaemon carinicauda TaxID=392227 RepID=UPI0035B62F1A